MEPEEPTPPIEKFIEAFRASIRDRQQQFDPDHHSDRYDVSENEIDPSEFTLEKKPSNILSIPQNAQGVLIKESPALLVFWTTDRYCTLNGRYFKYHKGPQKHSQVDGTLNFDALTVEMFITYNQKDNRVPKQFKLVPKGCKKEFIFSSRTPDDMFQWLKALTKSINTSLGKRIELTSITSYERFWKKSFFLERDFCETALTGDLVLFRGKKRNAVLQRRLTFDEFDHIAVVLKNVRNQVLLFEATNGSGVGVFPWTRLVRKKWYKDQEIIVYRRLELNRTKQFLMQVQVFVHKYIGNPYEFTIGKLFKRKSNEPEQDPKRSFFCSQLIAMLYKQIGLLPKSKSSTQYWPGSFSQAASLELLSTGKYGPARLKQDTIVVFQEKILQEQQAH